MSAMDHPAAHERIQDLLLEPARLANLASSSSPEDTALREHLAGCPTCRADLESWSGLQAAVAAALPADPGMAAAAVEPVSLPPSIREATLRSVRAAAASGDRPGARERSGWRRPTSWLALAAALVVAVGSVSVTVDQLSRRAAAETAAQDLAAALAVVDRMLATDHRVVELRTPEGAVAGTISWSRHDWVVLTPRLSEPEAGQEYACWLRTGGRNVRVGVMEFAAGTAYWVASLDEWQTWEIGATTRFVVTLEDLGATEPTGSAVLEAALAS